MVRRKSTKRVKGAEEKPALRPVKRTFHIRRISTGIAGLNTLIEGGFAKESINLLIGGSGCGKSIFSIQFLIEGIRHKEKVLYITFEEKKEGFYKNIKEIGIDLVRLEELGYFHFLEYTPEKVKTMLDEGGGAIENIVLTKKISRLVIDSITSFELLFDKEIEKREAVLSLFSLLRKWQVTALLTYEGSPFLEKRPTSRVLDFESDSMILLYLLRGEEERGRYLEILKMRGTNHSLHTHTYTIGDKGISVSTKKSPGILYGR
jgi:circadian clock protein KaiC